MIKNYWVSSSGRFIPVEDHFKIIEEKLNNKYTPEKYFEMLSRQGYLRLVETEDSVIIGYHKDRRLTDKLINILKDFALERRKNLLLEKPDHNQKPGLENGVIFSV